MEAKTGGLSLEQGLPPGSRLLLSDGDLQQILDRLAAELTERLAGVRPVLLCVLHGGIVFSGHLLVRLPFPLELGAVAVSRYRQELTGADLQWLMWPSLPLQGRVVVVLDDILDEGITLAALRHKVMASGAAQCLIVTMLQKNLGRPAATTADFVGAMVPNRYVFGFGLDMAGLWRNLPGIYGLEEDGGTVSPVEQG